MTNQHIKDTREDLRFIREAVNRGGDEPMPVHSRILWAVYSLIGFTVLDFWPQMANLALFGGFLLCFALDFILTPLLCPQRRERNRDMDRRVLCHMGGFTLSVMTIVALAFCGVFRGGYGMGQVILVLTGFHFITCGLTYSPTLRFRGNGALLLGLLAMPAAILVSFVDHGVWTAIGLIMAVIFAKGFELSPPSTPKVSDH